jgi:hypothetical protein
MIDTEVVGTMKVGDAIIIAYNQSGEALYIEPGYESVAEALLAKSEEPFNPATDPDPVYDDPERDTRFPATPPEDIAPGPDDETAA